MQQFDLVLILETLYEKGVLDKYPFMNQFTNKAYCGNGADVPKEWYIKFLISGEIICSDLGFLNFLIFNKAVPLCKGKRGISDLYEKYGELEGSEDLFEFPSEKSKWVWLAGIVDAESSLSLIKCKKKTKRGFQYIPRFSCASTTPLLLIQILKVCYPYGFLSSHHQDKRSDFWQKTRKVCITSNGLRVILPKIMPFLILKRKQAKILLRAMQLLSYGKKSAEKEKELFDLYLEIKKLNRRGKNAKVK